MARNLWRPSRFGLPGPVVGIIAVVLVLLIVVILWVRKGCSQDTEPTTPIVEVKTPEPDIPELTSAVTPPSGLPDTPRTTELPKLKPVEPQPKSTYEKYWEAGRKAFDQHNYVAARDQLSKALKGIKDQSTRKMIHHQLNTIANELTFSRHIKLGDTTVKSYRVKSGEYPAKVAKKFGITANLFMKINNIPDAYSMRADKDYKVIKGPFDVVINKKAFRLDVYLKDYYIKGYPIGLGRDNSTPAGTFVAGAKLEKPDWTGVVDASGRRMRVLHGDPRNPLGNHWISLRPLPKDGTQAKDTDYGIHGTNEPKTIGTQASRGCIRMRNEDAAEVFDLLVIGKSRITIITD